MINKNFNTYRAVIKVDAICNLYGKIIVILDLPVQSSSHHQRSRVQTDIELIMWVTIWKRLYSYVKNMLYIQKYNNKINSAIVTQTKKWVSLFIQKNFSYVGG